MQLGAQVFLRAGLPAAKQLHHRQVHMLRRHRPHRHALQIAPRLARCYALQIAGRARVHPQRLLQSIARKKLWMQCQQLLKNPQLQRQKFSPEKMWIQLKQLFQNRLGCAAGGHASGRGSSRRSLGGGCGFVRGGHRHGVLIIVLWWALSCNCAWHPFRRGMNRRVALNSAGTSR